MNRILRLLAIYLRSRRWNGGGSPLDTWRTPLRVFPNDLDLLGHVNNGVYLSLADLGRMDMTMRTGALGRLRQRGWYPVAVGASIRFRRSLKVWQRFVLTTRTIGWDERNVYIEHTFERESRSGGTETVAAGWVAARFLDRGGAPLPMADILKLFGSDVDSPPLPDDIVAWARATGIHR